MDYSIQRKKEKNGEEEKSGFSRLTTHKRQLNYRNCQKGTKMVNEIENNVKIINLSKYILNDVEKKLLCRGSKFCPTPQYPDLLDLEIDIHEFARSLLLKELFADITTNSAETSLVKKKGEFIPQEAKDPNLDLIVKKLKNYGMNLQSLPKNDVDFNITLAERKALLKLQSNNDIVIRESDKGSALVILDTNF